MSTLAKQQAALAKEEGKLKKLLASVQKFLSKEFLWVILVLLLAVPLGLVMTYLFNEYATSDQIMTVCDMISDRPLFVGFYVLNIAGIYFTRAVIGSIKTLVDKKSE